MTDTAQEELSRISERVRRQSKMLAKQNDRLTDLATAKVKIETAAREVQHALTIIAEWAEQSDEAELREGAAHTSAIARRAVEKLQEATA